MSEMRREHKITGVGFYAKLAWTGVRNNRRFYLPYILTCMGMVMMFYIISFLAYSPKLALLTGGETMQGVLQMGCGVVSVFAVIFLFYTNSFLSRRRKKEFGLYNILGMGKRNLSWILCWESLIVGIISIAGGLLAGILMSKFAELAMVNILTVQTDFAMDISGGAILDTIKLFVGIFVLLLLSMLWQVWKSNPIELLHSEQAGEKPPRANWLFAVVGLVILGTAYYLSVTIADPVSAMLWFFVAVVMVIVASYLLFISGSVALCRLLQKNKHYYYKANHFVSVSSMSYRMKRNGASLASICILCTMVLVMVTSTGCLYIGMEENLSSRYPRDIAFDIVADKIENFNEMKEKYASQIREIVSETVESYGQTPENVQDYRIAEFGAMMGEDMLVLDASGLAAFQVNTASKMIQVMVMSLEDYNTAAGTKETLEEGEALLCLTKEEKYEYDTIHVGETEGAKTLKIKKHVDKFIENGVDAMQILPTMYLIVPDVETVIAPLEGKLTEYGVPMVLMHWNYGVDLDCGEETQIQIYDEIYGKIGALAEQAKAESESAESGSIENESVESDSAQNGGIRAFAYSGECMARERVGFYGLLGGMFFLGVLLGIVFILATVLMLYYKQISEGYEDQSRFEIMQKVGMTTRQIKKSVNSQVLTVFFLPLAAAILHLAFAFPLIRKLLILFGFTNLQLLLIVTVVCVLVFALFYILVYRITSRVYYKIVA